MYVYEVGKEFPGRNYAIGRDASILSVNEASFDIILTMVKPSGFEKKVIRSEPLFYNCIVIESVPFILLNFRLQGITFDATLNFLKVNEADRESWLSRKANIVNLYLVNAETNILEAIRTLGVQEGFMERIKQACRQQLLDYSNYKEVDAVIERVYSQYSTDDLIRLTMQNL